MEYPQEVLTTSKRGKVEVRHLLDRGKYFRYEYRDPKTGKRSENKVKLVLLGEKEEEFFIIPMQDKRALLIPAESKGERKLWDGKEVVSL